MSEFEKKFYEYFDKNYKLGGHKYSKLLKKQIKDLAEIAEKDYAKKEKEYLEEIKGRDGIISKVIDERDELKKQIENIKYLDRGEVNSILVKLVNNWKNISGNSVEDGRKRYAKKKKAIDQICQLIPEEKEE